jgi:molecular chaperone GrpE
MSDVMMEETQDVVETPVEAPSPISREQIEASAEYQALNQQYVRLAADFENFRKRTLTEADNLRKYGAENTIKALLSALDNIERGTKSLNEGSDPALLYKSLGLLQQEIMNSLAQQGLSRLEVTGQPFDPTLHEAISQQPSTDIAADHIVNDVQAGYLLHDRVIRPALVIVSTGATEEAS